VKKIDSIGLFDVSLTITNQQNLCASTLVTPNGIRIVKSVGTPEPLTGISIYPNPTIRHLNISVGENINYHIRVLSIDGRELIPYTKNPTSINLQNLPAGIYLLELTSKGQSTKKLITKK